MIIRAAISNQFRTHPPCGLSILTVSEMYDTLLVEAFSQWGKWYRNQPNLTKTFQDSGWRSRCQRPESGLDRLVAAFRAT